MKILLSFLIILVASLPFAAHAQQQPFNPNGSFSQTYAALVDPTSGAKCSSAAPCSLLSSTTLPTGSATAANQTSSLSAPGTAQTQAQTIQGNAAGIPVPSAIVPAATISAAFGIAPSTSILSFLIAKAAPGLRYGYTMTQGATAGFLCFLNQTTVPAGAAAITPLECISAPAGGTVTFRQEIPDFYSAGIVALDTVSTTIYTADTPLTLAVYAK